MHIVIFDPDEEYLVMLQKEIIKNTDERVSVTIVSNQNDLQQIPRRNDDCYLVHESYFQAEESEQVKEQIKEQIKALRFGILVEGIYEERLLTQLNSLFGPKDYEALCINKYQGVKEFLIQAQAIYLENISLKTCKGKAKTKILSVFTPYGNKEISETLSEVTKNTFSASKGSKILILHFDPYQYYFKKATYLSCISYLFFQIVRKKRNIVYMIHEVCKRTSVFVDEINGPVHMDDIDEVEEKDLAFLLNQIKEDASYDFILLNLNGVHLTSNIRFLLNGSDFCLLNTVEEGVSEAIQSQVKVAWNIRMKEEEGILESILKRELESVEKEASRLAKDSQSF